MQKCLQNVSLNMFNRCYWNFRWWRTYSDAFVTYTLKFILVQTVTFNISLLFMVVPVQDVRACFYIKLLIFFFWKCSLQAHYDVYRTRTFLQNYSNFFKKRNAKSVITIFANITFCCLYFFRRGLTRHVKE